MGGGRKVEEGQGKWKMEDVGWRMLGGGCRERNGMERGRAADSGWRKGGNKKASL